MAEVRVARVEEAPIDVKKSSKRELYAMVAYHYPQYTLKEASKLPARDLYLLLNTANKIEAVKNINLLQITASPHSENGEAIQELLEHFKEIVKG